MTTRALPLPREHVPELERSGLVRRVPRLSPFVVFTLAAVVALFAIIFARISLDKNAFELQRLERQIVVEQGRQATLRVEAARLRDPLRVEQAAERMGMVFPDQRIPLEVPGISPSASGTRP